MAGNLPDFLAMSGWQRSDDEHPPGSGVPAYRIVYKTLKTYLPEIEMSWPNLVLREGMATSIAAACGWVRRCELVVSIAGSCLSPVTWRSTVRR